MTSNSQAQANLTTQTASEENYSNDYSGNHFLVLVVVGILDGTIVVVMVLTMVVVVVEEGLLMSNVRFVISLDMKQLIVIIDWRRIMFLLFLHQLHFPLLHLVQFPLLKLKVVKLLSNSYLLNQFNMFLPFLSNPSWFLLNLSMLFSSYNKSFHGLLNNSLVHIFIWLVLLPLPPKLRLGILIPVLPIVWLICHKTFNKWHLLRDLAKSPLVMVKVSTLIHQVFPLFSFLPV